MPDFSEYRSLTQITVLPAEGVINVQWANVVTRDGKEISRQYERKAYDMDNKDGFLAEVDNAAHYVAAIGW